MMAFLATFLSGTHPHIFPKSLLWLLENTHTFAARMSRSNLRIRGALTRMFEHILASHFTIWNITLRG